MIGFRSNAIKRVRCTTYVLTCSHLCFPYSNNAQVSAHPEARLSSPERARSSMRSTQRARQHEELGSPTRRRTRASINRHTSAVRALGTARTSLPPIQLRPPRTRDRLPSPPPQTSLSSGGVLTNEQGAENEVRDYMCIKGRIF
jgi:hypothetical protein